MSVTWARAATAMLCGYDQQHVIERETWHQLVEIPGVKRKLVRCAICAREVPPPDLTEAPVRYERFTKPMVPIKTLRLDVKAIQARNDD